MTWYIERDTLGDRYTNVQALMGTLGDEKWVGLDGIRQASQTRCQAVTTSRTHRQYGKDTRQRECHSYGCVPFVLVQ